MTIHGPSSKCPLCGTLVGLQRDDTRPRAIALKYRVAEYFNVKPADLVSQRRGHNLARARHVAFALAEQEYGLTRSAIGRMFNRDHTTVIYGLRRVAANPELLAAVAALRLQYQS